MRRLWLGLALAAVVALAAGSVTLAVASTRPGGRTGMMAGTGKSAGAMGYGMMGGAAAMMNGTMMGTVWLAGDGHRVASIMAARARAATAAAGAGLHPGEVIWFDNGFYVEFKDSVGASATAVIVAPATGTVLTEPGPAMMWNTRFGMSRGYPATATVSADRAQRIASTWLAANLPGRHANPPDSYPGYYTLETTSGTGTIDGMLSVNDYTGQVWYHSWHDRFIDREDS